MGKKQSNLDVDIDIEIINGLEKIAKKEGVTVEEVMEEALRYFFTNLYRERNELTEDRKKSINKLKVTINQ
jgi:uncharacterized protein YnzC (UPF0291/DUF896 family)